MPYKDADILELGEYCCDMVSDTIAFIDGLPTIEAQPVKHGRWMYPFYCSECRFVPYYSSDLTYNCGARMDGDDSNADLWVDDESVPNEDMRPDNEVM